MNTLSKHYYLALSYYYTANDISSAQEECLQALDFSPQNEEVLSFLKIISSKESTTTTFDKYTAQIFEEIIANKEIDAYLMLFIAIYGFQLPKNICWKYLTEEFVPTSPQHQVWNLILQNDWQRAYSHAMTLLMSVQGNPVVYFLLGILFFEQKKFDDAENYFFLLAKFGSVCTIAAVVMLLKLPQHNYKTLASSECIKNYMLFLKNKAQIFALGDILQKSWDEKAFLRYAKSIHKNILSTEESIHLAELYINNGDWTNAIKSCYVIKEIQHSELESLLHLFLNIPLVSFPPQLRKFFAWLIPRTPKNELFFLGQKLQKPFPDLGIRCFARIAKEKPADSLLGEAICYYYLRKYKHSRKKLEKLRGYPGYEDRIAKWQFVMEVENAPAKTLENAIHYYQNNKNTAIAEALEHLSAAVCPNCQKFRQNKSVCENCSYSLHEFFTWKNSHLQWKANELFFPKNFFLITTDALLYTEEEEVFFIIFSPRQLQLQLEIQKDNQPFHSEVIEAKGLYIFSKNGLSSGIYSVNISQKEVLAHQRFVVCENKEHIRIQCLQQNWNQNTLEIVFAITDLWETAIGWDSIALYDFALNRKYNCKKQERKDFYTHCYWDIPSDASSSLYVLVTIKSNIYTVGVKIRETKTWKDVQSLFLSSLAKTKLIYKNKKQYLKFNIPFSTGEVSVVTQPFGDDPIEVYREENVCADDPVRIMHPHFISGAYLGVTRFPGKDVQSVAIDTPFLLLHRPQRLEISYPEKIEPGTSFSINIKSPIQVKMFVFSRHKRIFNPLKDQLHYWGEEVLHLRTPDKNIVHDIWPTTLNANRLYKSFIGSFDMNEEITINVNAMPQEGSQKFTFLASDGHYFIEKTIAIEVSFEEKIIAKIPRKIGDKSHVSIPIELKAKKETPYRIEAKKRGLLQEGTTTSLQAPIDIYEPDTFSITFGQKKYTQTVRALDAIEIEKSIIEETTSVQTEQKKQTFDNTYLLIQNIGQNLLNMGSNNVEKVAADLYVMSTFYDFAVHNKLSLQPNQLEQKIKILQSKLFNYAKYFEQNLWAYQPGGVPDGQISLEILCHLAIFSEMPKFQISLDIMTSLCKVCLDANLKDNRLLSLSMDFEEKITSPESAAGLILHDIEVEKAIKYLQKNAKKAGNGSIYWESKNLGGNESATAWVVNALLKKDHYLAQDALKYLNTNVQEGIIKNTIATTSYIRALKRLARREEQISWQKVDYTENISLLTHSVSQKFSLLVSPEVIYQGQYFSISAKIKKVKYPKITLLIPAHIIIFHPQNPDILLKEDCNWPMQENNLNFRCKALTKGIGQFCIVVEETYHSSTKYYDTITITVV